MAHWAEIDKDNLVVRVLVFGDDKTESWIQDRFGGTWVQTSFTGSIRKNYAGKGYTYDADRDAFIPPQPFDSWVLNEESAQWEAPVPPPSDAISSENPNGVAYRWNEETTSWAEIPETSE